MQHVSEFHDGSSVELYVRELYQHILERVPADAELAHWVDVAQNQLSGAALFRRFVQSEEYKAKPKKKLAFPMGHYYSPIVDPAEARLHLTRDFTPRQSSGIPLSLAGMEAFWTRLLPFVEAIDFTDEPDGRHRYYYNNATFEHADAMTLFAMIGLVRPRRVIEIGSGFSSACMLDALDHFGLDEASITCIDPDPARLRGILRPDDHSRITLIEAPIQSLGTQMFAELQAGDILFIDSTHVLKTGSDVQWELFTLLPALAPGVWVHFHDIHYPFEYPDQWIFDHNFSWNEIYALRAFLMYNSRFEIVFWGSCLAAENRAMFERSYPPALRNPGGSLWIKVVAPD